MAASGIGILLFGYFLEHLPDLFTDLEPAAVPYWDATTSILSVTGMWLTTRKKLENWYYWLAVNIFASVIYKASLHDILWLWDFDKLRSRCYRFFPDIAAATQHCNCGGMVVSQGFILPEFLYSESLSIGPSSLKVHRQANL